MCHSDVELPAFVLRLSEADEPIRCEVSRHDMVLHMKDERR
jgi:hypothetical protein